MTQLVDAAGVAASRADLMVPFRSHWIPSVSGQNRDKFAFGWFVRSGGAWPLMMLLGVAGGRAAIYTRFSTEQQRSTEDQVRTCLEHAEKLGLRVDPAMIFSDEAHSGQLSNRENFQRMLAAMRLDKFDVIIFFSTSRLFRKQWKALQFIDTEILPRKKRCIFIAQNIDTIQDKQMWRAYMSRCAENDEYVTEMNKSAIRAAHIGKLRRGEVVGEMTYGYAGEDIPGTHNRRGKPLRRFVIFEEHAQWVRRIFRWFVIERMAYHEIAARLRRKGAPKPTRAPHWSWRSVRGVLGNPRYRGDFSYSHFENEYSDRGVRKIPRDKPLYEIHLPDLRIIDDDLFYKAQARIAAMPGAGGRRPARLDADDDAPRHPLSQFLQCPFHTDGWLWLTGGCIYCRRCYYEREHRVLFSMAPREVALAAICQRVAKEILRHASLVEQVIEAALTDATAQAAPNRGEVARHAAEIERLTAIIRYNQTNPGETAEDQTESQKILARLRAQRQAAQSQLTAAEAALATPRKLPTKEQLRSILQNLEQVLTTAASSSDPDQVRRITVILRQLIDAPIRVTQMGQMKKRLGWLRVHFDLHLERLVEGVTLPGVEPIPVSVDLVRPSTGIGREEEIMGLFRIGLPMKAIGRKLGISYDRIRKIVREQLEMHDVTAADVGARYRLPGGISEGGKHMRLAGSIMKMFHAGKLYSQIADEMRIDTHRVSDVIRAWHHQRGLEIPDGRHRRKSLALKNRPANVPANAA